MHPIPTCLLGVTLLLLVMSVWRVGRAQEGFVCNYAYTVPPTPRGCFRYTVRADDTCASVRATFKTSANNVVSTATDGYCSDPTTASASSSRAPPLKPGDTFQVCPPPDCVYKKLPYETTCGSLAERYNTSMNNIHFRERRSRSPMQPCVENQQTLPAGTRVQLCRSAARDTQQLLDTHDPTTYEDCKTRCHDNTSCTHMLYGNGTCKLLKRATPLMNIVSSTRDTSAFRCSSLPTLQHAGALPSEVGNYACDGNNTCAWLGGQGCGGKGSCMGPYQTAPSPSPHRCAWQSIAQQHPDIMANQQEFVNGEGQGDVGRFLSGVCGG